MLPKTVNRRKRTADLAIISAIALLYRALHLFFWSKTPYFRLPSLDELYHHVWASSIASGNIGFPTAFFRAPLYPYLLGGVYRIFGDGVWAPRIVQGLFGILGCLLVYILTERVSGDRRSALFAGIIIALSPMPALFESRLLLDWMLIPLGALVLILFLDAAEKRPATSLFAGFAAGLFAIARPNILAVFPFMLIWLFIASIKPNSRRILKIALAVLGLAIPILPVAAHNIAMDSHALVSTQGGLNLYLGNNAETDGITPILPGHGGDWTVLDAWRAAESEAGRSLDADGMDNFYRKKVFRFALDNPGTELRLLCRKFLLLLSVFEHGNNGSPEFFKKLSPPLRSPFKWGFLLPLCALALPLLRWNKRLSLMLIWLIFYGATVVIFFVNARFRLPLLVGVIPILASVIGKDAIKISVKRVFVGLLLFGLAVTASVILPYGKLGDRGVAESCFGLGNLYLREGDFKSADSLYSLAIETCPNIDRANLNRGIIAYRLKDYDLAGKYFEREAALDGGKRGLAFSNLGVIARLEGDGYAAKRYGKLSLDYNPVGTAPFINFAQTLLDFGETDSALVIARSGLAVDSLDLRLLNLAGISAMKSGDFLESEKFLLAAARPQSSEVLRYYELGGYYSIEAAGAQPDSAIVGRVNYNLGLLYSQKGDYPKAVEHLERSIKGLPAFPDAHIGLGTALERLEKPEDALAAFEKARNLGVESAELHYNIGLTLAQLGRYGEALSAFETAISMDSTFYLADEKIRLINKLSADGKISLE